MAEDREESIESGTDGIITKPIDKAHLIRTLYKYSDVVKKCSGKEVLVRHEN